MEDLKSISTALWEAMDFGGKILENITPGYRDFWDYGRICTLFGALLSGALLSGGLGVNLSVLLPMSPDCSCFVRVETTPFWSRCSKHEIAVKTSLFIWFAVLFENNH